MASPVAVEEGGPADLNPAFGGAGQLELVIDDEGFGFEALGNFGQFMRAQCLHDGLRTAIVVEAEELHKSAIGDLNATLFVQNKEPFHHAVEQGILLGLLLDGGLLVRCVQFLKATIGFRAIQVEDPSPPDVNRDQNGEQEDGEKPGHGLGSVRAWERVTSTRTKARCVRDAVSVPKVT